MKFPIVSVIIPTRNEEKFIEKCINSLLNTDYPKEKIEILVVDGLSEDNTREIVKKLSQKHKNIKLLTNYKKKKSPALNIGIKNSSGEIILIADAHSTYQKNYILKNVEHLLTSDAHNVGGVINVLPRRNSSKAKAISLCLSHPFGTGGASYRRKITEPKYVDTVPFGCYKREVFEKLGGFNEKLDRNMDIEFNLRMKKNGYKIMLFPDIKINYFARDNFKDLFKNNFQNGLWVILSTKYAKKAFSFRHLVPLFFVLFLISILFIFKFTILKTFYFSVLGLYLILNIFFSLKIAVKEKSFLIFFYSFLSFLILHISYGLGSLVGIFKRFFIKEWYKCISQKVQILEKM